MGLRDGVPIALGYIPVSFAFGLYAVSMGLTPTEAILISLFNLTSARQMAAVGRADAVRILIPMNRCDNIIVGVASLNTRALIDDAIARLAEIMK